MRRTHLGSWVVLGFTALALMAVVPAEDDIVEAMRRFTQNARRRAA